MEIREFANIEVDFYYDKRKENPYVVEYAWYGLTIEPTICNYSSAAFNRIIREQFDWQSRSGNNVNFRYEDLGLLLKFTSDFSDMNDIAKFDEDYGLNGTLVEFVKKELKVHIDDLKKQTDELEKGLEEC